MTGIPASDRVSYGRMTLLALPLLLLTHIGCPVLEMRTGWPVGDVRFILAPAILVSVWFLAMRWPLLQVPQSAPQQPSRSV